MAYYSFGKMDGSTDTQHTLHTDLVPLRELPDSINGVEQLSHRPDPDCILIKNWPRDSPAPQGKGRTRRTQNGLPISVQIMDLTYASDFKLEEAAVRKQAKYSNDARNIHRDSGRLDTALPYPREFENMPTEQQTKWKSKNYRYVDAEKGSTASCRLKAAGWIVDELPAVITVGMRGAMPIRNAEAYTTMGIPKSAHKQLNMDLHDLTIRHMQIMINAQHRIRKQKGFDLRRR